MIFGYKLSSLHPCLFFGGRLHITEFHFHYFEKYEKIKFLFNFVKY